jgi:hypothetical protein
MTRPRPSQQCQQYYYDAANRWVRCRKPYTIKGPDPDSEYGENAVLLENRSKAKKKSMRLCEEHATELAMSIIGRSVEIPWSGLFSNRTGPPKVCPRHASEYAHAYLEGSLNIYQKWALEIVMREIAEEVYHEQRREEEYDG